MSDRTTEIREAVAVFDSWQKALARRYPEAHNIEPAPTYATLAAAARAYADLLDSDPLIIRRCDHGLIGAHHIAHYGCDGSGCVQQCPGGVAAVVDTPKEKQ